MGELRDGLAVQLKARIGGAGRRADSLAINTRAPGRRCDPVNLADSSDVQSCRTNKEAADDKGFFGLGDIQLVLSSPDKEFDTGSSVVARARWSNLTFLQVCFIGGLVLYLEEDHKMPPNKTPPPEQTK